jgi:hypothetical protein
VAWTAFALLVMRIDPATLGLQKHDGKVSEQLKKPLSDHT